MEMQELEIIIEPDGNTQIHVKGAKGCGCMDITSQLEEKLGTVTERTFTGDYYEHREQASCYEMLSSRQSRTP